MAEITRVYRMKMPRVKLVGKRYTESEKENGTFSKKWEEWFNNGLFSPLKLSDEEYATEPFEDCNAYIGLSRCKEGEPYEYYIGVFMPESAEIPDGYDSVLFDEGEIAVCLVCGREPDIYFKCCLPSLKDVGVEWTADKDGVKWCFERYVSPRFTVPDENGNITLDMCFYVKEIE